MAAHPDDPAPSAYFDHAARELGIAPSPFIVTAQDLTTAGVDVETELKKLRSAAASQASWSKKLEQPQTAPAIGH